jgi:hypothetical protein
MTGGIALYDKSLRAIATVTGDEDLDELGYSCTAIADLDGDGIEDYAFGAPQHVRGAHPSGRGYVVVVNQSGKVLR